jgi:hypothetical protein
MLQSEYLCQPDCCMCPCPESYYALSFSPTSYYVIAGGAVLLTAWGNYRACNHGPTDYYYDSDRAAWKSWTTSVAVMNPADPGEVDGVAGGTSSITATYFDYVYSYNGVDCNGSLTGHQGSSTATVVALSISGPAAVPLCSGCPANGVNSMHLTATANPTGGSFSWSTTSGKISLGNTSSSTVTVTSAAASTSAGDTPVKVTYTYNGYPYTKTSWITVQKPSVLIIQGPDTTTSEGTCNAGVGTGCGVTRTFTYQVLDQIGGGEAINFAGMQVWDSITIGSPNDLGISGVTTTCTGTSAGTNNGPCNKATQSDGTFPEGPPFGTGLSVCSTACISGGTCVVPSKTTTAFQTIHVNGFAVQTQTLTDKCNKILVNGG